MNKPICPFCGTDKLKFFARIAGGYKRHYIGQFHCLKCGARTPRVNSRMMDYREHLTQAEEIELQNRTLHAFQPSKEEKKEDELL